MMNPPHMLGPSTSLGGNNSALQSSVLSEGALLSHSQPAREEIKKSFAARDGIYRVVVSAELSRPRPLPHYQMPAGLSSAAASQMAIAGSTVRVSFLDAPGNSKKRNVIGVESLSSSSSHGASASVSQDDQNTEDVTSDLICFNVGKELYVYSYRGVQTETDLSRPIDKRVYKGTSPTYHIFNPLTYTATSCQLLIGFTLGQLQVIDPLEKVIPSTVSRLYNEDRYIEKTSVTCIKWFPEDPSIFVASYSSGNLYVYDDKIPAATSSSNGSNHSPPWVSEKQGDKYCVYGWGSRSTARNPTARWAIGEGSIHQFEFSPNKQMLATVSHDGFLRVFNFETREMIATMKSYFGGLLTLSWSHDSKLIATGGEDDLLTVFHVPEKRVVCRGQAHKSWISQVRFDPHVRWLKEAATNKTASTANTSPDDGPRDLVSHGEPVASTSSHSNFEIRNQPTSRTEVSCNDAQDGTILYRIGSVGHDTCLCFWDITRNMLTQSHRRQRNSTVLPHPTEGVGRPERTQDAVIVASSHADTQQIVSAPLPPTNAPTTEKKKKEKKGFLRRFPFSRFSSSNQNDSSNNSQRTSTTNGAIANSEPSRRIPVLASQISCCVETRVLGTSVCPGIKDVPMIEPVMCKKVAHDRLTVLEFRPDCVVTACQEGYICTWARPSDDNKGAGVKTPSVETPESEAKPSVSAAASSYGYGSEVSNGVGPSRSSSVYSN
ncbi:unnamed protein product [Caenorhabditis brenneri]